MRSARKLVTRVAAASVLFGVALSAPAAAAGPARLTISGPAHVQYYALVTLRGSTPSPDETVTLYLRAAGTGRFVRSRTLRSDASGHFSTSRHMARTTSFYVRAGSQQSVTGVTRVPTATCTASGPVFTKLRGLAMPFRGQTGTDYAAALNATRKGLWAGVAHNGGTFAIFTWREGHRPVVLDRFSYQRVGFEAGYDGSVRITGITPRGTVVAAVQSRSPRLGFQGLTWTHGVQHRLSAAANWTSVEPRSITRSGAIIGTAIAGPQGHERYVIVRWAGPSAHFEVIHGDATNSTPIADARGDLAYENNAGELVVRSASGGTHVLDTIDAGGNLQAAAGNSFYGVSDRGVLRWDLASSPSGGPVEPTVLAGWENDHAWVTAVGPRGDLVTGWGRRRQHLRTANGAYVLMPQQPGPYAYGEAIAERGTTAYTATDRLPHLLRCH